MLADAHRDAALDIEDTLARMSDPAAWPRANRMLIDGYWGASFHWIAYGCQQKYAKHKEKHSGLVAFLREIGEPDVAVWWEALENIRNAGWYGHQAEPDNVQKAQARWQEIRSWALS